MTAIIVYGISIGDVFEGPNGGTLTVQSFPTPKNHSLPWEAIVINDAGEEIRLEVHDLENLRKVES